MFRFRLYKVRQFFLERFKNDLKTKVVRAAKSNFKEPIGNSSKKNRETFLSTHVISFSRVRCYINGTVTVVYLDGGDSEDSFKLASLLNLAAAASTAGLARFAAESSP